MASSSTNLDDSFTVGSSIDDVLSCPICCGLFRTPKVMPNCGHSICLECVLKIIQLSSHHDPNRISCPECRVVSPLGPHGAFGLKTNIQLQRTIALYETSGPRPDDQLAGSRSSDSFHDNCPHVFLTKAPLNCGHCSTKFCNGCGIAHMEKMKVEMIAMTGEFDQRLGHCQDGLDSKLEEIRGAIDKQLESTSLKITEDLQQIETKILAIFQKNKDRLIGKAQEARDRKIGEIVQVISRATETDAELQQRISELSKKSVLNCGLEEMAELYSKVATRNSNIEALKRLKCEPFEGRIAFIVDSSLEQDVLSRFSNLFEVNLSWQSLKEIEEEDFKKATLKIHAAAKSGNVGAIDQILSQEKWTELTRQMLVESFEDAETPSTPLMQAAKNGQVQVVRYLIEQRSANVRATISNRCVSSIHLACQYGHIDVVRYLAEHDHDLIKLRNYAGATPLAYAVHHGQLEMTRFLIETKCVDVEEIGAAAKTPLMEAATRGHLAIIEFLLEKGADLYARQPKTGNIAAHFAAMANRTDVVRFFLDHRPDLMIVKNYKGQTLIDMANDHAVISLLEERGARRRSLPDF